MSVDKKNKIIDMVIFGAMLIAVSAVTLYLFYRQCTGNPGLYHSDMKAYILEMQGLESGYNFPYPIFFKISAFINLFTSPEWAVAIATMLLNSGAMMLTKLAFNRALLCDCVGGGMAANDGETTERLGDTRVGTWGRGVLISVAVIALFFVSMLYPPKGIYLPGIKFIYLGVFTPNPFHNATYMAARPFAILAFLWFVKLLPVYEKGALRKRSDGTQSGALLQDYILFSVFLLLATMTKPSFTLVMVSTAGLVMLYRMLRSGFRNFVPTIQLGICFVPTFIDLLYQYSGVFVPDDGAEGGLGFCFGEIWGQYSDNIPLAVCLAVGFPLLVLVLHFKEYKKNSLFLYSWQFFAVSFLEAFFLYEKGFRKYDFNFSWGYICGIFFCHFSALLLLLKTTGRFLGRGGIAGNGNVEDCGASKGNAGNGNAGGRRGKNSTENRWGNRKLQVALVAAQWLAFAWHLLCGLWYFKDFLQGKMYY